MEQLANFAKSFEYNNNRVLEVLNMSSKSNSSLISNNNDSSDVLSNGSEDFLIGDEENSIDIDITDMSSNDDENLQNKQAELAYNLKTTSPMSLIKRSNRDGSKYVTKNWLISDIPKKKPQGQLKKFRITNNGIIKNYKNIFYRSTRY